MRDIVKRLKTHIKLKKGKDKYQTKYAGLLKLKNEVISMKFRVIVTHGETENL